MILETYASPLRRLLHASAVVLFAIELAGCASSANECTPSFGSVCDGDRLQSCVMTSCEDAMFACTPHFIIETDACEDACIDEGARSAICGPRGTDLGCVAGTPFAIGADNAIVLDVDGDSRPDVLALFDAVATANGTSGSGDGTSGPDARLVVFRGTDSGAFTESTRVDLAGATALSGRGSFAAGDFDGDGHVDVAYVAVAQLATLHGNGDGTFAPASYMKVDSEIASGEGTLSAVDVDGDGISDLVAGVHGVRESSLFVLLGTRGASFRIGSHIMIGDRDPQNQVFADFDGDHIVDVAVPSSLPAESSPTVQVFLGDGSGAFHPGPVFDVGADPVSLVAADFDGNGAIDIASANFTDMTVSIVLNDAGGAFRPQRVIGPLGESLTTLVAADFDGDGRTDLFAGADHHVSFVFSGREGDALGPPRPVDPARANMTPLGVVMRSGSADLLVRTEHGLSIVSRGCQ